MSLLKYATINLSKQELVLLQDLIAKEKNNLSNKICSPTTKPSLTNILQNEYQICRDLNFVFKTELQKF